MISDVEHLFICILTTCMSSLEKCLFRSFVHFLSGFFLILICMSCFSFWTLAPCWFTLLANIFSQSVGCLFILLMVLFAVQKILSLIRSHWLYHFLLMPQLMGIWLIAPFWLVWIMLLLNIHVQVFWWMYIFNFQSCVFAGLHAKLFSKTAVPFYVLTNSVWEFQFLYILLSTCYCPSSCL